MDENIVQSVQFVQRSEIGSKRDVNQDATGTRLPSVEQGSQHALFVVADGVGGNLPKGEIASRTAVDALLTYYFNRPDSVDMLERAADALQDTNMAVRNQATAEAVTTIGTTIVGLALSPHGDIIGFNVGDSRLYRIRDEKIELVSVDQVIQAEPGVLKDEIAVRRATKISSYMGQPTTLEPNFYRLKAQVGDTFLLCTDGIWSKVSDQELLDIITGNTLEAAADHIVKLDYERGAPDNLSLILIQLGAKSKRHAANKGTGCLSPLLVIGGIIAATAVIVGGAAVINSGILAAPTPTPTATASNTPTATATLTSTTTPSMIPTATNTSTVTVTPTPTQTATPTATSTATPTGTATHTAIPTLTASYTPTVTSTVTNTPSDTPTTTPSSTVTPTTAPTSTLNPTLVTWTPLPPTDTPTATYTPTEGPSPTPTLTPTLIPFVPQVETDIQLEESLDLYSNMSQALSGSSDQPPTLIPAGTTIRVEWNRTFSSSGITWSYLRVMYADGTESSGWGVVPVPAAVPMLTVHTAAALRYGPNGKYESVRSLSLGEKAEILAYFVSGADRWYYVRAESSGSLGWVWEGNVNTSATLDTIPLKTDFPPLPTNTPSTIVPSLPPEATTPEATAET